MTDAATAGELALELVGEAARGQPEIERRIDQGGQLLLIEDAAGAGQRRLSRGQIPGPGRPRRDSAAPGRGSLPGGKSARSLPMSKNSRYQSIVRRSPSSRVNRGAHPRTRRALAAVRY